MSKSSRIKPPKWPLRFLRFFLKEEYLEEIEGDMEELFQDALERHFQKKAKRLYAWEVLKLLRPSLIKNLKGDYHHNAYDMFKNNLKIAWRNLFKNKSFSLINIGGLAMGILVPMLIGLWIHDEISFNKQFENHDHIAAVMQNQTFNGKIETWRGQAMQLEPELRNNHNDYFKYIATATGSWEHLLTVDDKKITKTGAFIGSDITEMLSLKMLKGARSALQNPTSVLLASSTSQVLFGEEDPIGKGLLLDNELAVTVEGVYEDLPDNSSFGDLNFIAPWELHVKSENLIERVGWGNSWFQVYVQLADNTDLQQVSTAIKDAKLNNIDEEYANRTKPQLFLHPMSRWYLHGEFENGVSIGGRIEYVWLFGVIAGFVLLLACINFMNLSTARSEKRAKEVGIRKTLGSFRSQLINQFFSESLLVAGIAFIFALILASLLLPTFNKMADKEISVLWSDPWFWLIGLGFTLLTGIIAGSYPAFYLSAFRPVKALKGTFRLGRFAALPRKILVVVQFTVSISLIIGTIFIFRQIQFAKDRPIGYNRNNLVRVPIKTDDLITHFQALRTDLLNTGMVEEMAGTDVPITATYVTNGGFDWPGKDPNMGDNFTTLRATHEFGDMIEWEIKEGRGFSREFATDTACFVLNEAAVEYMGLKDPIGTMVKWGDNGHFKVIGVVKNLITQSPYDPVRQTIFILHETWLSQINIKLKPESVAREALTQIEAIFKKYDPVNPFEYQFVDEAYARKFKSEERIGKLASFFAILAIFISCLGLFGLASYVAERRTKEIGIRKVLGASVVNLWRMLSKDFVLLVLISCFLAAPIAYYFMNNWLQDYTYRTGLSWWVFAIVGLLALLLTLITVSFQALKAALMNPVNSIKNE